jgi:hypothetical protein
MAENVINVILKHSSKISYTMCASGEKGSNVSTNGKMLLSMGRLYQIPVDTNEKLDDHNIFKVKGELAETINVRNIRDGLAIISPLVHNVLLTNSQELGSFI